MGKDNDKLKSEQLLVDVLTEMPVQFEAGGRYFNIYPKSFGLKMLIDNLKPQLEVDEENVKINPTLECLRICQDKQDLVLRMISYATTRKRWKMQDAEHIAKRCAFFKDNLALEDMATLLLHIIKDEESYIRELKKYLHIFSENERKRNILKHKEKSKNNVSVGGVSIYGSIISYFAETYGWSMEYIMWEISYANLMLLYSDHMDSIFLTDDERKKIPSNLIGDASDVIDASDPKNAEKVMNLIKNQSWR